MRRHAAPFAASLLAWLSCACAPVASPTPAPGSRRVLLSVPYTPDRAKRGAPAALAAVLSFWARETTPSELENELDRDSFRATLTGDLEKAAQSRGFSAETFDATLAQVRAQIDQGRPLIALVEDGPPLWRAGRYVVITGYDDDLHALYVHMGKVKNRIYAYGDFYRVWDRTRRCAVLVRPAGPPATAGEPERSAEGMP
jgi:ABC-type bacteriocin/lantibiotic exporter with double-glycine peptidase domain